MSRRILPGAVAVWLATVTEPCGQKHRPQSSILGRLAVSLSRFSRSASKEEGSSEAHASLLTVLQPVRQDHDYTL